MLQHRLPDIVEQVIDVERARSSNWISPVECRCGPAPSGRLPPSSVATRSAIALAATFRTHLVGTTAERVVRKSRRPVLMVRQVAHEHYRRVLVPADFSDWSSPSVEIATAVAPEAQLLLMHTVEVPFESRLRLAGVEQVVIEGYRTKLRSEATQRLHELAARAGLDVSRWRPLALNGRSSPWVHIVQQEQEHDCNLIVIGKHGRNTLEDLLLGSTTRMVIAESSSDVLVCTNTS